ncbi:MAG: hypothetical protein F6J98_37820 [Moorea sp. SIO4G2]|nr:hypothetical protein [Moorena sp. SIO4G2]
MRWWYGARLPNQRVIVSLISDRKLLQQYRRLVFTRRCSRQLKQLMRSQIMLKVNLKL